MTTTALAPPPPAVPPEASTPPDRIELELRAGLAASWIDGHLQRAARGRDFSNRILAFYFDELNESRKYKDLGYTCLAQYADQRLGFAPRRARELCLAGRALSTLTRIDRACRDGLLCWTKTELLTHGVGEHQQDEWIERARRVSCTELRGMLQRHRKGLTVERTRDGGLPRSEIGIAATISATLAEKFEQVRGELMRRRGVAVDDSEVLSHLVQEYELPERDVATEAERAAACEQDETPDWLRRDVLARDGHRCLACGTPGASGAGRLHVHHIVFRSRGGLTRADNLTTVCVRCHGLIHEGRLFAKGLAPGGVEFHNRFGEPLLARGSSGMSIPVPVLRLLCEAGKSGGSCGSGEGGVQCGGQPPRGARPVEDKPRFLSPSDIPDDIDGEWFKKHMHLLEPDRNGVWRIMKSARR